MRHIMISHKGYNIISKLIKLTYNQQYEETLAIKEYMEMNYSSYNNFADQISFLCYKLDNCSRPSYRNEKDYHPFARELITRTRRNRISFTSTKPQVYQNFFSRVNFFITQFKMLPSSVLLSEFHPERHSFFY